MAFSGKLTSIRQVVESAYMDAGIDEINYPFAVETCVNLMGIIGLPELYSSKVSNGDSIPYITVEDYKAKLPEDLVDLTDIRRVRLREDGSVIQFSEMIESSDIYHLNPNMDIDINPNSRYETNHPSMSLNEYDELEVGDGVIVGGLDNLNMNTHYTYKIQDDYIFTNFKDGVIQIAYKGYSLDDEGFPLIPDDEKFKNALKYELVFKLDWKKWRVNPASPGLKALLNDSEQRRDWYVGAARSKGRIPSMAQMESIKNQWLRTIPKMNQHSNGFGTNNIIEHRYNQSSGPRHKRY